MWDPTPPTPPRSRYVSAPPTPPNPSAGSQRAPAWHGDRDRGVPCPARALLLVVGRGPLPAGDKDRLSLLTVPSPGTDLGFPGTDLGCPGCSVPPGQCVSPSSGKEPPGWVLVPPKSPGRAVAPWGVGSGSAHVPVGSVPAAQLARRWPGRATGSCQTCSRQPDKLGQGPPGPAARGTGLVPWGATLWAAGRTRAACALGHDGPCRSVVPHTPSWCPGKAVCSLVCGAAL